MWKIVQRVNRTAEIGHNDHDDYCLIQQKQPVALYDSIFRVHFKQFEKTSLLHDKFIFNPNQDTWGVTAPHEFYDFIHFLPDDTHHLRVLILVYI